MQDTLSPDVVARETSPVVLLVEDHDDTRMMCALGLALEGFTIEEAANGTAALARLSELTPDIVVTDLSMPDMDGAELCRRIRALPCGGTLPILVLTGHVTSPMFLQLSAAGACAACAKPLAPDGLAATVRSLLAERSACTKCWQTGAEFTPTTLAASVYGWKRQRTGAT